MRDRTVTLVLPPDAQAPGVARRSLDGFSDVVDERRLNDVRLMVSELVTNSVKHATEAGHLRVLARAHNGNLRVVVQNPGRARIRFPERDRYAEGGYGLGLVNKLANRWGIVTTDCTEVWLEIDLTNDEN